jgi:hypothetical protein
MLSVVLMGSCERGPAPAEPPTLLSADCAQGEHPLTLRCTAALSAPAPTTWTFRGSDGTARVLQRPEAEELELGAWGFAADTDLDWEVRTPSGAAAAGRVRTGSLPQELAALQLVTSGTPRALDHFVVPYRCASAGSGLVLLGTDGVIRWQQAFPAEEAMVGFDWVGDELVVALGGQRVLRQDTMGEARFEVELEGPLHHDVAIRGEQTVALFAYEEDGRVLDGMYVLDERGETLATWRLSDVLAVEGQGGGGSYWMDRWPFATDWSHTNSVAPDGEAHVLLSLRWQDALLRVVADPTRSDFGAVDWILTGSEDTDLSGDFVWTDPGGFDGQHHASRLADGGIAVFDNGPTDSESRVLFMQLDEGSGTVQEGRSWSAGQHCPVQGGAYELPGGGALATCSTAGQLLELAPDEPAAVWSAVLTCQGEPVSGLGRARPVSLP